MKTHAQIGFRILSINSDMQQIAEQICAHHERWDRKGYPKGLKGNEIPLESRICAIADAYDAMVSARSYKTSMTKAHAIEELKRSAGTQFDSDLVDVFIEKVLCHDTTKLKSNIDLNSL